MDKNRTYQNYLKIRNLPQNVDIFGHMNKKLFFKNSKQSLFSMNFDFLEDMNKKLILSQNVHYVGYIWKKNQLFKIIVK